MDWRWLVGELFVVACSGMTYIFKASIRQQQTVQALDLRLKVLAAQLVVIFCPFIDFLFAQRCPGSC